MQNASVVFAVVACAAALASCSQDHPRPDAAIAPASVPAPASTPVQVTLANPKIAPVLAAVARRVRTASKASTEAARSTALVHVNAAGELQAYVHVTRIAPDVENALHQAGAQVERASAALGVYQVWAAPAALERIATLPAVTRITPPAYRFIRPHVPASAT